MKINKIFLGCVFVGILNLIFISSGFSGKYPDVKPVSPPLMQPTAVQPVVRQTGPGLFEISGCKIIKEKNKVEFQAVMNMNQGVIEYLIVNTGGKVHTSLLQTSVDPSVLKISLMMIGLQGTVQPPVEQGESIIPEGDRVKISLAWNENGKDRIMPVEQLILKQGNAIDQMPWVFTGSQNEKNGVQGLVEKSLVAIYHDPAALIDHQLIEGNNNNLWSINSEAVPPLGTLVNVIIKNPATIAWKKN